MGFPSESTLWTRRNTFSIRFCGVQTTTISSVSTPLSAGSAKDSSGRADHRVFLRSSDKENAAVTVVVEPGIIEVTTVENIREANFIDQGIQLAPIIFHSWCEDDLLRNTSLIVDVRETKVEFHTRFRFAKPRPFVGLQTEPNLSHISYIVYYIGLLRQDADMEHTF
nr:hypothetical protein [Paenibacillus agricola]